MTKKANTKTQQIRELNDLLRTTLKGGGVVMTLGIQNLETEELKSVFQLVQGFDDFHEDNDPYGEHDFGSVITPQGNKVFWKIDYYDKRSEFLSEDPSDPEKTRRILTIMLASEY